jgi:hypothetical protein
MKEILKKDLVQNILESQEMDELAYKQRFQKTASQSGRLEKGQGESKFNPETGEWERPKPSRVKRLFTTKPEHDELKRRGLVGKREEDLPIAYVANPTQETGKGTVFISLDENQTEELLRSNKAWVDWFEDLITPMIGTDPEKHTVDPEAKIHFVDWVKDIGYKADKRYPPNLHKITEPQNEKLKALTGVDLHLGIGTKDTKPRETFLRDLYPIIRKKLDGLNETMLLMGFPSIEFNTQEEGKQRKHTDFYSKKENEDVSLESHNVFTYNNYREFAEEAADLLDVHDAPEGEEKRIEINRVGENQARQKNPGIRWEFERKQIKTSDEFKRNPLTRVYRLDREGKKADEKDYITVTFFNLRGVHDEDEKKYSWEASVRVEISEKLREESKRYGNLKEVVTFRSSASVPVPHGLNYSEKSSILDNHPQIRKAVDVVLDDLRNKLTGYNPVPQLEERIFKKRSETTKRYDLAESEIVDLIRDTIQSTKK